MSLLLCEVKVQKVKAIKDLKLANIALTTFKLENQSLSLISGNLTSE